MSGDNFNARPPACHTGDHFGEFRHCRINNQPRSTEYDEEPKTGSFNPRTGLNDIYNTDCYGALPAGTGYPTADRTITSERETTMACGVLTEEIFFGDTTGGCINKAWYDSNEAELWIAILAAIGIGILIHFGR